MLVEGKEGEGRGGKFLMFLFFSPISAFPFFFSFFFRCLRVRVCFFLLVEIIGLCCKRRRHIYHHYALRIALCILACTYVCM